MADSTNSSTISPEIEVLERFASSGHSGIARGGFSYRKSPRWVLILPMSLIVLYAPEAKML
jgi:hypothetical protein